MRVTDCGEDALLLILAACASEADLLALSAACRSMRSLVVSCESVWSERMRRRHASEIEALFDGSVPPPPPGRSWMLHAYDFERSWLELARRKSGRVLLRMSTDCAAFHPTYLGVPPGPACVLSLRVPILDVPLPISLSLFGLRRGSERFGVYDVTDFVQDHPGAEPLLLAAAEHNDCTIGFDAANHSERARAILRTLAVPGLEALPEAPPLARPRPSIVARGVGAVVRRLRALRALPALLWRVAVQCAVAQLAGRSGGDASGEDARPRATLVEELSRCSWGGASCSSGKRPVESGTGCASESIE